MARTLADELGIPSYVVDPVVTDELMDAARLTGLPEVERRSLFHALNQRGVARRVAERLGVAYDERNFIVCHMGGGITIGAHRQGRVVDVVNGLDGEGPFTPERTGALPILPLLRGLRDGTFTLDSLEQAVLRQGGMYAHLSTNDPREVVARIENGDKQAGKVFEALAYTIAKHIGSMVPALVVDESGPAVAAVILTGGLARSEPLVAAVTRLVRWLGPVEVVPGELEMASLAAGAQRALEGIAPVQIYHSSEKEK